MQCIERKCKHMNIVFRKMRIESWQILRKKWEVTCRTHTQKHEVANKNQRLIVWRSSGGFANLWLAQAVTKWVRVWQTFVSFNLVYAHHEGDCNVGCIAEHCRLGLFFDFVSKDAMHEDSVDERSASSKARKSSPDLLVTWIFEIVLHSVLPQNIHKFDWFRVIAQRGLRQNNQTTEADRTKR